jgi:transcriptional regulator with XRE-family HTH domain
MLLSDYRKSAGLTLADVARVAGVGVGAVFYWEHGRSNPRPAELRRMERRFKVKLDFKPRETTAVAYVRGRMGMTQKEFAKFLGVGQGEVSLLERGKRKPTAKIKEALKNGCHRKKD